MKKDSAWKQNLILILGAILIVASYTITGTYSLFENSSQAYGTVIAASQEDIISHMEIVYSSNHMPVIRLEKGNNIDYSPIVFFSIEGEAKHYVLNINPVKVDDVVEVAIKTNVNLPQALSLIASSEDEIGGTLKVKHLNEFINETLEFKLHKGSLLRSFFTNQNLARYIPRNLNKGQRGELVDFVGYSLLYSKEYLEWQWLDWLEEKDWIGRLEIDRDQALLIDIIAPNLLEYNERLYDFYEISMMELQKAREDNDRLSGENKQLSGQNQELSQTIEDLKGQNRRLGNSIYSLEAEIQNLLDRLENEAEKLVDKPGIPEEPEIPETPSQPEETKESEAPETLDAIKEPDIENELEI